MVLLLTGASGFLGRYILKELSKNVDVTAISRTSQNERIKNIDLAECFDLDGEFSSVIHLAGKNHLQENETSLEYFKSNLNTTITVLELCRKKDIKRIVFASSLSVYGKKFQGTITEQSPAKPDSMYSLSKWFAEQVIELYSELYGINYSILRYSTIFGQGQEKNNLLSVFVERCRKNLDVEIGKDSFRNYVFVKDAAIAAVSSINIKGNGVFNIAAKKNISLSEAVNKIKVVFKSRSNVVVKSPADNSFKIDITRASKQLDFKESISFEKVVEEMRLVKHV